MKWGFRDERGSEWLCAHIGITPLSSGASCLAVARGLALAGGGPGTAPSAGRELFVPVLPAEPGAFVPRWRALPRTRLLGFRLTPPPHDLNAKRQRLARHKGRLQGGGGPARLPRRDNVSPMLMACPPAVPCQRSAWLPSRGAAASSRHGPCGGDTPRVGTALATWAAQPRLLAALPTPVARVPFTAPWPAGT